MLPLLVVRPEPGASRTAAAADALGLRADIIPLFGIAPLRWTVPDPRDFDALLLTSANAARHAGSALTAFVNLPCHCVGAATAAAASAAGLHPVNVGRGGAQPLVDVMVASGFRRLLWLAGRDRSPIAAGPARITVRTVYAAQPIADPAGWSTAIARPAVVMLHSERAARRAAALAGPARKHLIALTISAKVAAAAGPGWARYVVSDAAGDGAMLALARQLCQNPVQ